MARAKTIKKVSNVIKIATVFVVLYETLFLNNPKEFWMILNKTRGTIYCKQFSLKVTNKSCYKWLKYCKCT